MSTAPSSSSATAPATPAAAPTLVAPAVPRIEAMELGALLESADAKPLVVDVRDPATTGGFIKGAINVPKVLFDTDEFVDDFVDKHATPGAVLVFHCLNSNGRGPTAAGRVYDRIQTKFADDDKNKPQVHVLRGGFRVFSETYGLDSPLVDPSDLH